MTRLLLDTHVLIWANSSPGQLGPETTELLTDSSTDVVVSSISVAEIAIKRSIGRLEMSMPILDLLTALDATELALSAEHAVALERLPLLHRDPFDRILIAQAQSEGLTLLSADDRVLSYPAPLLNARS